jgi:hypothetical protein
MEKKNKLNATGVFFYSEGVYSRYGLLG